MQAVGTDRRRSTEQTHSGVVPKHTHTSSGIPGLSLTLRLAWFPNIAYPSLKSMLFLKNVFLESFKKGPNFLTETLDSVWSKLLPTWATTDPYSYLPWHSSYSLCLQRFKTLINLLHNFILDKKFGRRRVAQELNFRLQSVRIWVGDRGEEMYLSCLILQCSMKVQSNLQQLLQHLRIDTFHERCTAVSSTLNKRWQENPAA